MTTIGAAPVASLPAWYSQAAHSTPSEVKVTSERSTGRAEPNP